MCWDSGTKMSTLTWVTFPPGAFVPLPLLGLPSVKWVLGAHPSSPPPAREPLYVRPSPCAPGTAWSLEWQERAPRELGVPTLARLRAPGSSKEPRKPARRERAGEPEGQPGPPRSPSPALSGLPGWGGWGQQAEPRLGPGIQGPSGHGAPGAPHSETRGQDTPWERPPRLRKSPLRPLSASVPDRSRLPRPPPRRCRLRPPPAPPPSSRSGSPPPPPAPPRPRRRSQDRARFHTPRLRGGRGATPHPARTSQRRLFRLGEGRAGRRSSRLPLGAFLFR